MQFGHLSHDSLHAAQLAPSRAWLGSQVLKLGAALAEESLSQRRVEAEALFFAGNSSVQSGDDRHAESCFRQALELVADFSEAHANLGLVLDGRGDHQGAEACYRTALAIAPERSQVHLNLGTLLAAQNRFDEAQAAYAEAIRCDPHSSAAWSNLGVLFIGRKLEQDAEVCLNKALELDPGNAKARFNLSYLALRQGRFDQGWSYLEARDWYRALEGYFTYPRWRGESLQGRSLLISYEAGHGDMIQFCRYAQVMKAQGARHITLICHPALKTLLQTLQGVDLVMAFDEDVARSGCDYWTPLMSLPFHQQTRADSIPADIPYLHPRVDLIRQWNELLPTGKLRVGLVWKGNPRFDNDADRSLPSLELLHPLWQVSGVSFVSLQKGAGEQEAQQARSELPMLHLGTQLADFADAAAIVSNLDLMICVDTAMAHLAGALGKPCWLLLADHMPDWRWLSQGHQSSWYPLGMRIFRQPSRGDWASVVAQLVPALQDFCHAQQGLIARS